TWPDINEDMTVPDYIVRGNIVIEDDVMLTVMPGVVVQFESAGDGITVANGALRAVGRGDKPIIFKGLRENKGSWLGLQFFSNDARNELAYCKVMHAGSTNGSQTAINVKGNLGIYPAQLKISNTEVSQSGGYGIIIDKVSHFGSFRTNSFHECDRAGARITNPQIGSLDASSNFFGNVLNYVEILGEGVVNYNVTLPRLAVPYLVENGDIRIMNGSLQVAPGAEIRFKPSTSIIVDETGVGSLVAIGTAAQPIVFKGTQNIRAAWKGVAIFNASTANVLRYCTVDGGGQLPQGVLSAGRANIVVGNSALNYPYANIENCIIKNSAGYGIYHGGNPSINVNPGQINGTAATANQFINNAAANIGN
ncbi:MAG: hypothetical protein RI894_2139, partial [Bacteroidota bacterium]